MIKFFRKIRQNLLSSGKTALYMRYAVGEITLVVAGILIALQINNWNENQKRKVLEIKHLKELKSDIEETMIDLTLDLSLHQKNIQSGLYLEDFFFNKIPYHDSLTYHFYQCIEDYQLYPKTSALESIKSTGLDILSNDSLRLKLTHFFQIKVEPLVDLGRVSQGSNSFTNILWPYFEKHFKPLDEPIKEDESWYNDKKGGITHPPRKWKVIDVKKLQNDYKLQLKLSRAVTLRQGIVVGFLEAKEMGESLLELIDTEISRLQSKK